jgi:alcohol dehydrogenase class IV
MAQEYINEGIRAPLEMIGEEVFGERVVIIRGSKSYSCGEDIESQLRKFEVKEISHLEGFSNNPNFSEIVSAGKKINSLRPDFVIGCGGGSILDIAKILRHFATQKIDTAIFSQIIGGERRFDSQAKVPLLLMPTTAGSGAQNTHFSVVYHEGEKYSLADEALLPDFVIADRSLVESAPRAVLASSAMDAFAQAAESFWAIGGTSVSQGLAAQALKLLWDSIATGVIGRDQVAIEKLITASHLAGKAINISKTTGNHALSYKITTDYDVPHGHCVGMLLPKFFELHQSIFQQDAPRGRPAVDKQNKILELLGFEDFSDFSLEYKNLLQLIGLEDFSALNAIRQFDSAKIIASVNLERLRNHPIVLTPKDLEMIFA